MKKKVYFKPNIDERIVIASDIILASSLNVSDEDIFITDYDEWIF